MLHAIKIAFNKHTSSKEKRSHCSLNYECKILNHQNKRCSGKLEVKDDCGQTLVRELQDKVYWPNFEAHLRPNRGTTAAQLRPNRGRKVQSPK